MQLKSQACKSTRAIGQRFIGTWSVALLCGSVIAACSGTIDTPTEEYPARQPDSAAGGTSSSTASSSNNATASAGTSSTRAPTPAASNDEDQAAAAADDEPAAAADDEPSAAADDPPSAAATELSFEADIWPIFQADCGPCHVTENYGGQNIGSDELATALSDTKRIGNRLIARVENGGMPPGCSGPPGSGGGCIEEDEFQDIEDWLAAGSPE